MYPFPVNDPWYSAHQVDPKYHDFVRKNFNITGYFSDHPASTLGCAMQHQICYPDDGGNPLYCSHLGGQADLHNLLASLPQDERQRNLTEWSVLATVGGSTLRSFLLLQGSSSLTYKYNMAISVHWPIADNQWQLDVEHWHASILAIMQGFAVETATGPSNPGMRPFCVPPQDEQEQYLCRNQVSFSAGSCVRESYSHVGCRKSYPQRTQTSAFSALHAS